MAKLHPCPECHIPGRRKTFAEYPDNFYCHYCGHMELKKGLDTLEKKLFKKQEVKLVSSSFTFSDDLPKEALKWLYSYQLYEEEIANFKWATSRDGKECQLLLLYQSDSYWQARNFGEGSKYLSEGVKPVLTYGTGDTIVLVEDIISAIKVGRVVCASPLLGSIVPERILSTLEGFKKVCLWLDFDKAKENVISARNLAERLGKPVEFIITALDPKKYSMEIIKEKLK